MHSPPAVVRKACLKCHEFDYAWIGQKTAYFLEDWGDIYLVLDIQMCYEICVIKCIYTN